MDIDTINQINREEEIYNEWVRAEKSRILKMTNYEKKKAAWNHLFPPSTRSDEYLAGNVF